MYKLGILLPGQGSQYPGMGLDFPLADSYLEKIKELTQLDLKKAIETGEGLSETKHTQLSVFLHSILAFEAFQSLNPTYEGVAGFSLGEYSALFIANVFDLETGFNLVYNRSKFMSDATQENEGAMAAVLGLEANRITEILKEVNSGLMVAANFNSPLQTVISGEKTALEEASVLLKKEAKRVIPLAVSGAFHSPLMASAAQELEVYLKDINLNEPSLSLYLNVNGDKAERTSLKEQMRLQVIKPVQFVKTIENMKRDGFTHLIEIGPGQVLSGLVKKIDDQIETFSFEKINQIDALKGWLEQYGFIK